MRYAIPFDFEVPYATVGHEGMTPVMRIVADTVFCNPSLDGASYWMR